MLLWYIYQLVGIVGYKLAAFYLNGVSYPFIRMENIQLLFIVGYVESTTVGSNATEGEDLNCCE